ncbi:MAG: DUF2971 domain-containing protein [Brooklawnia sp.]
MAASEDGSVLYHYTSAAGLLGIVQDRRLWATESNFLNDPSEIAFAASVVQDTLHLTLQALPANSPNKPEIKQLCSWIAEMYQDPHAKNQYHEDRSFIASFSLSDDVLTLWRSYSGENGFCVGFDRALLTSCFREEVPNLNSAAPIRDQEEVEAMRINFALSPSFLEVAYGEDAAQTLSDQILALALDSDFSFDRDEHKVRDILRSLVAVKHGAYADEREVRLVIRRTGDFSPNRSVRVSPSLGLVAYHELAFLHNAIVSITTAPGIEQSRAENAVRSLLWDGGRGAWSHVDIRSTEIPFSW